MDKKYEILENDTKLIPYKNITVYRIRALKDFGDVKKGDLGGYIESEHNLSHENTCWVYGEAFVFGYAKVYDHAKVFGDARVYDYAKIYGYAKVYDHASVYEKAEVTCSAHVYEYASVYGHGVVYGFAKVFGYAIIEGKVFGLARIGGRYHIRSCDIECSSLFPTA